MTDTIKDSISQGELIELHTIGFKLIALTHNNKEIESWTPIYDNPNYWNPERLKQESYKFKNVATYFRKTHLKDQQGQDLYLNCLDIDSDNVYDILFNLENSNTGQKYSLIAKLQAVTFVTKTKKRNGFHIYWLSHKQNKSIVTEDCKKDYEFEIKTDKSKGHCTLPSSTHRYDPNFYYKNYGQNKIIVSDELYDELMKLLAADCLKAEYGGEEGKTKYNNTFDSKYHTPIITFTDEEVQTICDIISPYYKRGCECRHSIVFCLCGLCHKQGVDKESAIKLVESLAKEDEEKKSRLLVLEETYKKDPKDVSGSKQLLAVSEHVTGDDKIAKDMFQKIFSIITSKRDDEKIDYVILLTDDIMAEYMFKTMKDTEQIYYYDNDKGVYIEGGEWLIKEQCEILFPAVPMYKVQEVINHIKRRTGVERFKFDSDNPNILNLQNGLLNIETGEFTEHSPNYLSLVQLPIRYDPKAKCPNILKFLGQVLHPQDVFTAMEIIGYCIYKSAKYEKAVMLFGPGSNGKGVFIKLIEAFVGLENTSHVPLQDLDKDKFALADLYCKMVNTFADLKAEKLSTTGMFKTLVSGDTIRAQKKYGQPFSFRNYSKLIFSANKIPDSDDKSYAYYKRWLILPFEKVFDGNDRIKKDTSLINKLTTPDELSGLLNLALIALKQLHKDGGFKDVSVEKIRKEYDENSNTVKAFLDDKCAVDLTAPEYYTLTTNVYNEYLLFCKERNERPLEMNIFGKELAKHGIEKERIRYYGGDREYCYMGIKLRSDLRGQDQMSLPS